MDEQFRTNDSSTGGPGPGQRDLSSRPASGSIVRTLSRICFAAVLLLVLLSCVPSASAGEVILSTPQSSYYFPAGEEAVIPVTLASTYSGDITGTLQQSLTRLTPGSGSRDTIVQSRVFAAFTEQRTVMLSVARSDVPADYLLTIVFRYDEGGARTTRLGTVAVHFVSSMEGTPTAANPLTGSDTADPVAGSSSGNAAPTGNAPAESPAAALQNNQMTQDTSALKEQMAGESNQSEQEGSELLAVVMADPLVQSRSSTLTGAGFILNRSGITPVSNRSGSFLLTYSAGIKEAAIRGDVADARVLFAEESAAVPVPLPEALADNASYQAYAIRVAGNGFTRDETRINSTPVHETMDLAYTDPHHRTVRMHAEMVNGSVVSIAGESPEDPLAAALPTIALMCTILISAGIWYLARSHRADALPVPSPIPALVPPPNPREIALRLLDEAEQDAARSRWPEACRKIGRAIRIVLSHEIGRGEELTSGELEHLIGSLSEDADGDTGKIREVLDRCRTVGFAKGTPGPGEFSAMLRYSRHLVCQDFSHPWRDGGTQENPP